MSWPLPWWAYLLIWWAGMIPAAFVAGDAAKRQRAKPEAKPLTDFQVAVFVMGWPVWVALFPMAYAYRVAQKAKGDGPPRPERRPPPPSKPPKA